ncbi:MAG: dual specificity protein phosphatase family protein [Deltaproteobacteria bacterium]|nr:dual specificity protein phosphatase family protein [Deltaproteobacteria bacterium]
MPAYPLTWITEQLAVGHAPMSYQELDSIREQGVVAMVNLCGEYCDLHQIERDHGFEVYYLPVDDDQAPSLQEMEKALQWLDESIYLGKRILVHCTHGIGRTGTFVTSYLLRRGFSLKLARKKLKKTRVESTSFNQWWFLRKFGKKEGALTIREPSIEGSRLVNLNPYFVEYEALVEEAEALFHLFHQDRPETPRCGLDTDSCCHRFFQVELVEAAHLSYHLNRKLSSEDRLQAIQRGIETDREICRTLSSPGTGRNEARETPPGKALEPPGYRCPLSVQARCIAFASRPVTCRLHGIPSAHCLDELQERLDELSRRLFFALNGVFLEEKLHFPLPHVVSGKFVQDYFSFITKPARS